MGECPIVTVTDYSLMNELFVKNGDAFVGRDFLNHLSKLVEGKYSLNILIEPLVINKNPLYKLIEK